MMFVTQSQKDYIDAATGTESKREFMESETANRFRALGADPEIAYDEDLPPPVDGEEDTDLEDAFMDPDSPDGEIWGFLSQIRHDYERGINEYQKIGQERLEKNRELIPAAKEYMQTSMEEAANRSPRDIAAFGLDSTANTIYNFTKSGIDFTQIDDMPAEVGMALPALMEMYDRLPNGTWKGTQRFASSVIKDPVNFVGGVANFKLVRQLLAKGGTKAVREHLMERAAKAAGYTIIGAEGSAYAAMAEYMNQKLSHDPEQGEWQPDWPQIFAMGGFGVVAAAGGTAAIRAVPDAVRAGREIVTEKVAPAVRDLFDAPAEAGTTLTSGVGPVPATAADEVSAPAPVFFSAVSNAVDALPMEKGSAQQMRAMIAKSEGVKPEEMAWTGLDDFLKGKKSVTKAEVQEYMQANEVKIEEVTLPRNRDVGIKSSEDYRAELEEMSDERLAQEVVDEFGGDFEKVLADITDGVYDYIDDLVGAFSQTLRGRGLDDAGRLEDRTKFGEYTLPGGENYREVLLTLPEGQTPLNAYNKRLDEVAEAHGADNNSQGFQEYATPSEIEELAALQHAAINANDMDPVFRGGHFDEPNVLAHMRLNDRTGPNGEKILFIEEIQSDWHQKGRKSGYNTPETKAKLDALKAQRKKILEQRDADAPDWFDRYVELSKERAAAYPDASQISEAKEVEFRNLSQQKAEFNAKTKSLLADVDSQITSMSSNIPDAPLKKTWHEMSFRRVARMAAEEGYDAIAWTPGKVQAERYDLSKQISEIHLSGTDFKAFGLYGEEVIARTGVTPDDLPELIGKEAADRLLSEKPKNGLRSLTGEQLEVGGEGMKGFYDKILKNYAAKWGKKFGSKVGVTEVATAGPASVLEIVENEAHWSRLVTGESTFTVVDRTNGGQVADFRTQQEAQKYIENELADTKVWTLPVTKKMRDSVLKKGVPLFGAAGVAGGAATSDTSESPDI